MSFAPIPKTAPLAEDEIALLNRLVGPATPLQRAWLSGFLAGLDAREGAAQAPVAVPQTLEPLTVLFASESGNAERLAADVAKAARKKGFKPNMVDMADLDVTTLAKARRLVVIASTWGEGEPPSRAARGYADLMGAKAPRLDGVEFGVLALGDTAYADFCGVGKALDARLEELGARRAVARIDCDLDYAAPAADWIGRALDTLAPAQPQGGSVIAVDFSSRPAAAPDLGPVAAEVGGHVNLNSSRSDKETIHLALGFNGGALAYVT